MSVGRASSCPQPQKALPCHHSSWHWRAGRVFPRELSALWLLICVIRNRSETHTRLTWHCSVVRNGCLSSAGASPWFRGGSRGQVGLSRDELCSDEHILLQSPTSSQTSCSLLLWKRMHMLVMDGLQASTEAMQSDHTSGLSHANENKAPGTGALEESIWEVRSNTLCDQDLTQQIVQQNPQSNEWK